MERHTQVLIQKTTLHIMNRLINLLSPLANALSVIFYRWQEYLQLDLQFLQTINNLVLLIVVLSYDV